MTETEMRRIYVARATSAFPDVRFFIRNVGKFATDWGGRVRVGIEGQADIEAIVKGGKHLEIELKNIRTPQTAAQKNWQSWCESWGIPYLLLRARDDDPFAAWLASTAEFLRTVRR